jgi:hypothetical protein
MVRRALPFVLIAILVVFAALQLVPMRITHPPVRAEPPWDSPATRQLAVSACFDCHSNQTRSFWYEKVAPISWWIKGHVTDGRNALNFSEWDPNNHRGGTQVGRTISRGEMPPSSYTWLGRHRDAKLTPSEKQQLIAGLEKTLGSQAGRRGRG